MNFYMMGMVGMMLAADMFWEMMGIPAKAATKAVTTAPVKAPVKPAPLKAVK